MTLNTKTFVSTSQTRSFVWNQRLQLCLLVELSSTYGKSTCRDFAGVSGEAVPCCRNEGSSPGAVRLQTLIHRVSALQDAELFPSPPRKASSLFSVLSPPSPLSLPPPRLRKRKKKNSCGDGETADDDSLDFSSHTRAQQT